VSIDPEPRAAIDATICDEVMREGLETCDLGVFERLRPGDIVFFDGALKPEPAAEIGGTEDPP